MFLWENSYKRSASHLKCHTVTYNKTNDYNYVLYISNLKIGETHMAVHVVVHNNIKDNNETTGSVKG